MEKPINYNLTILEYLKRFLEVFSADDLNYQKGFVMDILISLLNYSDSFLKLFIHYYMNTMDLADSSKVKDVRSEMMLTSLFDILTQISQSLNFSNSNDERTSIFLDILDSASFISVHV